MFSKSEPAILLKWPAAWIPLASVYFLSPQIVYHGPYGVPTGIPVVLAEEAVPPGQQILDKGTVTGAPAAGLPTASQRHSASPVTNRDAYCFAPSS